MIRLDDAVLRLRKFRKKNPDYRPGKPCVYVGVTSLDPDDRFEQHKNGHKAARYASKYGMRLMRKKYERLNPVAAHEAENQERTLAEKLRRKGYGVWQN